MPIVLTTDSCSDAFTGVLCAIGNRIHDHDSSFFTEEIEALTVSYAGEEAQATLSLAEPNSARTRTFTARWGIHSASFSVDTSDESYLSDSNFTVQNVVDWLGSLPGWTASLADGSRRAAALSITGKRGGAFPDMDAKTAPLTLVTMFDFHSDLVQRLSADNVIFAGNVLTEGVCQNIFLAGSSFKDVLIANNCFHNKDGSRQFSQLGHDQSHIVIAHNSWSQQSFRLRGDAGYAPDSFCLIDNNTMPGLQWIKTASAELKIAGNHLQEGATDPMYATGTTASGEGSSLFVDAAAGDFVPAGDLAKAVREPAMRFDLGGMRRNRRAPTGAMNFPARHHRRQTEGG